MKTGMYKNHLFQGCAILALSGCVSTGTEQVDKSIYNFELGNSPLSTNVYIDSNDKASVDKPSTSESLSHRDFSSQAITPLPSITSAEFSNLNQEPRFASNEKSLSVSFDEVLITDFIHRVFGDALNLDYAISPEVEAIRHRVILRVQDKLSPIELYRVSTSLLQENGVTVFSKDNILYFQRAQRNDRNAVAIGIGAEPESVPTTNGKINQLIPYTFDSGDNIRRIVGQLSNVTISDLRDQKLFMVEGSREEILRALQLIKMLDAPNAKGRDIRIINLAFASTSEMTDILTQVLTEEGIRVGSNGDVAFVPIARQNSLIVYATSSTMGSRVEKWSRKLDKPEETNQARFFIYRPKFSKAENLHNALSSFVQTEARRPSAPIANNAPAADTERQSDSIISDNSFKISVDEVQNSLLIQATPNQYSQLLELLTQLDKLPPQVALDVAIAEFDISDNFTAGISKILYDSSVSADNKSVISLEPLQGALGFSGVFDSTTIDFSLIASKSKSRVLSRPYLVVQDGESASISAGKQVPIQVGSSTTDGGNTSTDIQYRSTGVSLSVTPTINADGVVSLKIQQSVSGSEPGPTALNPIITDRSLQTSVLVGNGQTAILGGLIQNNDSNRGNSVPILSSIPLLGNIFKARADSFSRSELVIMITPRIMNKTTQLDDFTQSFNQVFSFDLGIPNSQTKENTE